MPETSADGPVRLAELLGALSPFADLADGFPADKVLRTTILALELGKVAGVADSVLRDTYFVCLLRYAGCIGFSHEEAHEYGAGDDLMVRNVMAMADVANPLRTASDIVQRVGRHAALAPRARAVARLLSDTSAATRHAHAQCETSLWVARLVGMSPSVLTALEQICERHDGRGAPHGISRDALELSIRLYHVADIAEIVLHRAGPEKAIAEVERRAGTHFDPDLARHFVAHARPLFESVAANDVWQTFLEAEPEPHVFAQGPRIDDVARALGSLADIKSVFTVEHSRRVAALASGAADALGFGVAETRDLVRAAWLHDLGRVAVPNGIWDKPGPLSLNEWERVRLHAYCTERILKRAGPLASIAGLASGTHERIDSLGYPKGLPAPAQGRAARVLAAADVAAALGETRPHRAAHGADTTRDALLGEVRAGRLDRDSVDAVLSAAGMIPKTTLASPGITARELEVLRLLARGKSNREIGTLLGISSRTVQNHVAHVYDKIGAYSRAGATLYAVERGLLAEET